MIIRNWKASTLTFVLMHIIVGAVVHLDFFSVEEKIVLSALWMYIDESEQKPVIGRKNRQIRYLVATRKSRKVAFDNSRVGIFIKKLFYE